MMKKTIFILIALLFMSSLLFATAEITTAKVGGTSILYNSGFSYESQDDDYLILNLKGITIPTGSVNYIELEIENIYHWDHFDFTVVSTDGDSITTSNVSWRMPGAIETISETLTSASPITYLKSNILNLKIYNPSANVETVSTLNFRLGND